MTRVVPWALAVLSALLLTACSRAPAPLPDAAPSVSLTVDAFTGGSAWRELTDFLAIGPRESGTEGAARAASYLRDRLTAHGLVSRVDVFTNAAPDGPLVFRNVLATLPGATPTHTVLLISHYDTKSGLGPDFVGANDSGSSTALLLALGAHLGSATEQPFDLVLAFVDGEECRRVYGPNDGLHGSRRLAAWARTHSPPVRAAIVADMIGDRDLTVTLPRNSDDALVSLVFQAAARQGVRHRFSLAPGAILDDHVPFLDAGIPAVDLIDFQYGSAPGKNDLWHTPNDTIDHLSPDSLETIGRVVLDMLESMAR